MCNVDANNVQISRSLMATITIILYKERRWLWRCSVQHCTGWSNSKVPKIFGCNAQNYLDAVCNIVIVYGAQGGVGWLYRDHLRWCCCWGGGGGVTFLEEFLLKPTTAPVQLVSWSLSCVLLCILCLASWQYTTNTNNSAVVRCWCRPHHQINMNPKTIPQYFTPYI